MSAPSIFDVTAQLRMAVGNSVAEDMVNWLESEENLKQVELQCIR